MEGFCERVNMYNTSTNCNFCCTYFLLHHIFPSIGLNENLKGFGSIYSLRSSYSTTYNICSRVVLGSPSARFGSARFFADRLYTYYLRSPRTNNRGPHQKPDGPICCFSARLIGSAHRLDPSAKNPNHYH